jgi:Tol biopolymer transport system component
MTLPTGTRLGAYEIVALLGRGGMGEVYRARDTKLNRAVALKILPDAFAADPDRMARFTREAQTLGSLNHPSIAQIHGFEDSGPVHALVMELVEGQDLSEMIGAAKARPYGHKGIPLADALPIAKQIADALEAAHDAGIIHRDLKPANVKVRDDGTVKVLDFGLAKAMESGAAKATPYVPSESPTMLSPAMTEIGMILGTASYMSPEQAKGRVVDKRADIWAFGVVLFEMLTGRALFDGDSVAETIGLVATRDPDWSALPASTPAGVRRLLARCLTRDPKHRLRDIGEARIALATPDDPPVEQAAGLPVVARRERTVWAGVVLAVAAVATTGAWLLKPTPVITNIVSRFSFTLPADQTLTGGTGRRLIAISPDGTKLAYIANRQIYLRALDQLEAQPIRGSNENPYELTFSPDGQWLAYFDRVTGGSWTLKKIAVAGGVPVTLSPTGIDPVTLSWRANTMMFAQFRPGKFHVIQTLPDSGGTPQTVVTLDPEKERAGWPQLLDDGVHVLMTVTPATAVSQADVDVVVQSMTTGKRTLLVHGGTDPRLLSSGHLVYSREGALHAVAIDTKRFEVTGSPVEIVERVLSGTQFAIADNGTLAFMPGGGESEAVSRRTIVWVDRQGKEEPIAAKSRNYFHVRLSPDSKKIALESRDEEHDIWIWDLAREALTRLTFGPAGEGYPVWTPDSRRVLYRSDDRAGTTIFRKAADGTGIAERLAHSEIEASPNSLSPGGRHLVYRGGTAKTDRDLMLLPLDPLGPARPLVQTAFTEDNGEVSPDGRWIAYESNESGTYEIFVRPFPATETGKWQVTTGGATRPMWSRNSRERLYVTGTDGNETLMGMGVPPLPVGSAFTNGKAAVVLSLASYHAGAIRAFDISADGRRFLLVKNGDNAAPPSITVVSHWFDELRARVK